MFSNELMNIIEAELVSRYHLYAGRDVPVTVARIDEALLCERTVIPANTAGWRTGAIAPAAIVAGGAVVVTSLAFAAWRFRRHHETSRKRLREDLETLRTEKDCADGDFRTREEDLITKNEELHVVLRQRDQLVHDLLADDERLKEDCKALENKLHEMERTLEENEQNLTIMIAKKDHQIEDLLAKEQTNVEAFHRLENKLIDALSDKEEAKRELQQKEDLIIYYRTQIMEKDDKIHDFMENEDEMRKEHQLLDQKLGDALDKLEVTEKLLQKKDVEKNDLTNLFNNLIEKKDRQIEDLLAKENKMEKACGLLEQNLREALKNNKDMESLLDEKDVEKKDLANQFDNLIENKDHQIEDLLSKECEMKKACDHLEGKLREALGNHEDIVRLLKEKEDEMTGLEAYCKTQIEKREQKIQELLAQEENMESKIESLEEKLAEALCNTEEMEKVLERRKQNIELTNIYEKKN
ncbi:synaptonemal complex protein 1-like [Macrobrachium rosenbergii]|uniref:synaptonemal complex protein 1-like n=1 Tax=Macrobrachium rosenbergii TaxID=79674 RepID=UPI0034D76268